MIWSAPQRVRNWYPKHGVQSDVTKNGAAYTIQSVRNFVYDQNGSAREEWLRGVTVTPQNAVRLWYLLEPFTNSPAIAHPYFVFEFVDGTTLCFTIEGKWLNGTAYSAIKGFLREYELGYVWMTERDALTMPLTHAAKALYLYPLTFTATEVQNILHTLLNDTHALFETPEFYNTITNNCTIRFAQTLKRIGHRIPFDMSWFLPGYSDRYFKRLGIIAPETELRSPAIDLVARKSEVWGDIESNSEKLFQKVFKLLT
jgi:hypothetical protein